MPYALVLTDPDQVSLTLSIDRIKFVDLLLDLTYALFRLLNLRLKQDVLIPTCAD